MRRHAAPIGITLLLVAVAVSGCGSGAKHAQAQAPAADNLYASADIAMASPVAIEVSLPTNPQPALDQTGASTTSTATESPTRTPLPTLTPRPTASPLPTATTTRPTATAAPTATAQPTRVPPTATARPVAKVTAAVNQSQGLTPPQRIVAPTIGLDAPVVTVGWHQVKNTDGTTGLEWDVASHAAGWHKTSAMPGQNGNVVVAGHSNIDGEVFLHLGDLKVGDPITVFAGGHEFDYRVEQRFVVPETGVSLEERMAHARWIGPFPDARLTLLTCWPPNNNTHRIFIIAKPVQGG